MKSVTHEFAWFISAEISGRLPRSWRQNDPADIPRLLAKLNEGYDVVSGWRAQRQDAALRRNLPSKVANWLISTLSGVRLHDYGCILKAYRREALRDVKLYGEMHRFITI
jgi:hypothetical protein